MREAVSGLGRSSSDPRTMLRRSPRHPPRHVSFAYPGTSRLVLRHIAFFACGFGGRTSARMARVNNSGQVLAKMYEPTSGAILSMTSPARIPAGEWPPVWPRFPGFLSFEFAPVMWSVWATASSGRCPRRYRRDRAGANDVLFAWGPAWKHNSAPLGPEG